MKWPDATERRNLDGEDWLDLTYTHATPCLRQLAHFGFPSSHLRFRRRQSRHPVRLRVPLPAMFLDRWVYDVVMAWWESHEIMLGRLT